MDADTIEAFLTGQLQPQIEQRWAAHLQQCSLCQQAVENHQKLSKLLRLVEPVQLPGGVERTLARVADAVRPPSRWRRFRPLLVAVAAGVACGVAAGWGVAQVANRTAAGSRSGPAVDSTVIAEADALLVLAEDPWLVDSYQAVCWFERLLLNEAEVPTP